MKIIPVSRTDFHDIRILLLASFDNEAEANLVENLRKAGDDEISLVAKLDNKIVAHVMFSTMTAPFKALGLGPVCVSEKWRNLGIGAQIINAGLAAAKTANWQMVFVLGNPQYYQRCGFSTALAEKFDCAFNGPYLMAKNLGERSIPTARLEYAPAFLQL